MTTAAHWPVVALTVIFEGQTMVGAWLSVTVTVKAHDEVAPFPAVTTKVLTVVPTGKDEPLVKPVD